MANRIRTTVGSLNSAKARKSIDGFDDLKRNLLRLSDQVRVEVLNKSVQEGADETRDIMIELAPENPGGPTWKDVGHGSEHILIAKPRRKSKRDARTLNVGPGPRGRHLVFQEFGTQYHDSQPFVRPTANRMRRRMVKIIEKHMRTAIRRGVR